MSESYEKRYSSRIRLVIAIGAISASVLAILFPLSLAILRVSVFHQQQYDALMMRLVSDHFCVLSLLVFVANGVVFLTAIDVLRCKGWAIRSAAPFILVVLVLNVGATTWYWSREARRIVRQLRRHGKHTQILD